MKQSPSRFKLAIFWCGLFGLLALVVLAGLETLLRVTLNRRFTAETGFPLVRSQVPGLGYQLAANHTGDEIQSDANGFRLRPASAGSISHNVLVLGDSISFGSGVKYSKSYVPALEKALTLGSGRTVAVWNSGVPGYNTSQEAAMLDRAAPVVHPDLVVLEYCMNDYLDTPVLTPGGTLDATTTANGTAFSPAALLYNLRSVVFFKEKFKDIQRARPEWFPVWAHYVHHLPRKPGWEWSKQALLRIQNSTSRMNARFLVVIFPVEQQLRIGDRAAQDDLLKFTREHGIETLDLYDSFRSHWKDGLYINFWKQAGQFDKLHPNENGHALAAAEISAAILARKERLLDGGPSVTRVGLAQKHVELAVSH